MVGSRGGCDTAALAGRWSSGIALSVLAAVAVALPAAAATPGKGYTLLPASYLHLESSDIYCTVLTETVGPVVACFHDPGGPTSNKRKGYAIAAADSFVAVEPTGSNTPILLKKEPSLAKFAAVHGGKASKSIIEVGLNDTAAVGGTHMEVLVTTATGGGNAIGIIYLDSGHAPVTGSYVVGISNHYVTVVKVTGPQKAEPVYRHRVF